MAQSIKLGSNTYLDASGVVMSDHTTLDAQTTGVYKAPDGTMIQWGEEMQYSLAFSNLWGSIYFANADPIAFHMSFIAKPSVFICHSELASFMPMTVEANASGITKLQLARGTSSGASDTKISWIAIGRWK